MIDWSRIALAFCAVACGVTACMVRSTSSVGMAGGSTETWTNGSDAGGTIYGDGGPSASPMLAIVDPNTTMNQTPGQGVGVFAQYQSSTDADPGGHWYVWWTCDTSISALPCDFTVGVRAADGEISNVKSEGFGSGDELTGASGDSSTTSATAQTTTTTTVQGVKFDTRPGAEIQLSASLGGEYSGAFVFFVQDNAINGGYQGELTDPIDLQPSSP
jgi:hypothetical protein